MCNCSPLQPIISLIFHSLPAPAPTFSLRKIEAFLFVSLRSFKTNFKLSFFVPAATGCLRHTRPIETQTIGSG
jgi:hypothetical protein